ncbi:MAG TPA: aldehyde dehydrogenase [Bacteroides sp.]|nr:aldehyde dehydrogenase [Bacteroides sp.]
MNDSDIQVIIQRQENFFRSGITLDTNFRLDALRKLKHLLWDYDEQITEALKQDLGKHPFETYASEHGLAIQEIGIMIRNLNKWSRPQRAYTPMAHWFARSYYINQPYGRVLIISPWNYPLQLLFMPLIGAVAAGNCVLAKPSRHAAHTTRVMQKLISENFDPGHISLIEGGSQVNQYLLDQQFDYIFFTGSTQVGKKVMEAASRHLTPVSLELGGKSPVIVEPDSSPELAAKRILWGKLLNSGQSCVAPDYLLVHRDIKDKLIEEMNKYLQSAYGSDIKSNPDYGRMINQANTEHLAETLKGKKIIIGGETDVAEKYIAPTVVEVNDLNDILMQEEVFGPILPLVEYNDLGEALEIIRSKPRPLSLYIFTRNKKTQQKIILSTQSGTGGINDTVIHFVNPNLPFGGVGKSGMGRYHGKYSFETFSYKRSFLNKATWIDIPVRYPPYGKKMWLIRKLIR